jgi:hypothetical protein
MNGSLRIAVSITVLFGCSAPAQADFDFLDLDLPTLEVERFWISQNTASHPIVNLAISQILGDTLTFGAVGLMIVSGDQVIVLDPYISPHVAVMDLADPNRPIRRYAPHGDGPGEVRYPSWAFIPDHAPDTLWIYDRRTRGLLSYSLSDKRTRQPSPVVRIGSTYPASQPLFRPGGIVTNGLFPDRHLLRTDSSGAPIEWVRIGPKVAQEVMPDPWGRARLNYNRMAVDPGHQRFALAFQAENRIDIFDIDGTYRHSVAGPLSVSTRYALAAAGNRHVLRWSESNELAYVSVAASNCHIYALFCGACRQEGRLPSIVHQWTWDGDFVGQIILDREVQNIAVAPNDRMLLGALDYPIPAVGLWHIHAGVGTTGAACSGV